MVAGRCDQVTGFLRRVRQHRYIIRDLEVLAPLNNRAKSPDRYYGDVEYWREGE